jgi:hypothetical protein
MGIFSFFSKDKKEKLDQGLSKTKESFFTKVNRAIAGKSKVDDQVLDELEEILIGSDVGVDTTLRIIERIYYCQNSRGSLGHTRRFAGTGRFPGLFCFGFREWSRSLRGRRYFGLYR